MARVTKRTTGSHPEVCTPHRRNGFGRSTHLDVRRGLPPKQVQQQLTRRTAEPSRRRTRSNDGPAAGPFNGKPTTLKSPAQKATPAANVAPQRRVQVGRQSARPKAIGPANVLLMNEEFIEVRQLPDPPEAEEPCGRAGPDPCHRAPELTTRHRDPAPLGEPLEGSGQHETRSRNDIAFSQNQMGGEIASGPAVDQRGRGRAEFVEKIAERRPLPRVWRGRRNGRGHDCRVRQSRCAPDQ